MKTCGRAAAEAEAESPFTILGFLQWGAFAPALIGVFLVLRRGSTADTEPAGAHAAA